MRVRLRPALTPELLDEFCAVPHDHRNYPSHQLRVDHTIALGRALLRETRTRNPLVMDLSCGNGIIPWELAAPGRLVLGDFAAGYEITGLIEDTIHEMGHAGLFVFSETAEHLDDPDSVLTAIRKHADLLLMSTPLAETSAHNQQHVWGWDADGVREMLTATGWEPVLWSTVTGPHDSFQIWGCQ